MHAILKLPPKIFEFFCRTKRFIRHHQRLLKESTPTTSSYNIQ